MHFAASFGSRMYSAGFPFKGKLLEDDAKKLAYDIVGSIGMTPVNWHVESFAGRGVGFTGVLFLIESQVTIDSYDPHAQIGYVWINSCKPFDIRQAFEAVGRAGLVHGEGFFQEMGTEWQDGGAE